MRDEELKALVTRYFELHGTGTQAQRREMGRPMRPHEAMFLYGLILRERPAVIFESGTAVGWSATWMALASDAPVYTYDPTAREQLFGPKDKQFHFIHAEFATVRGQLPSWLYEKKLFVIDGDHTRAGVNRDFKAIEEFLEAGDILVFHDTIGEGGVGRALYGIKKAYPHWRWESIDTANGMEVVTCV